MNGFRLVADSSHMLAILILLYKILKTKSTAGISGRSQVVFALVYTCRYLDLFTYFFSLYNSIAKIFYLLTAYLILFLIYSHYPSQKTQEEDRFPIAYLILPCIPIAMRHSVQYELLDIMWTFSIYLEAVAILPQLLMLKNHKKIDPMMVCYLLAMGAYRGLYIFNWIYRGIYEGFNEPVTFTAGLVYTSIYVAFAFHRIAMAISERWQSSVPYQGISTISVDSTNKSDENTKSVDGTKPYLTNIPSLLDSPKTSII